MTAHEDTGCLTIYPVLCEQAETAVVQGAQLSRVLCIANTLFLSTKTQAGSQTGTPAVAALHGSERRRRDRRQRVQAAQRRRALLEAGQHGRARERRELRDARVARVAQPGAARLVARVQALSKLRAGLRSARNALQVVPRAYGIVKSPGSCWSGFNSATLTLA